MIEAWLSSSEMTASCSPSSTSNTPPLASKQDGNRIVASVPRKAESLSSSSTCWVWVPQMNRTLAIPKPHVSSAVLGRGDEAGVVRQPEVVVGAEVQDVPATRADVRRLRRGELALRLVEAGGPDLGQGRLELVANGGVDVAPPSAQLQSMMTLPRSPVRAAANASAQRAAGKRSVMIGEMSRPVLTMAFMAYQVSNISRP